MISAGVAPPNSLVIVEDSAGGVIADPERLRDSTITATDSLVAICVQNAQDGDTEITLGSAREFDSGNPPAFQGVLKTPTRRVAVRTVLLETILEFPVPHETADIRVWVNHPTEPDAVIISLD